MVLQTIQEYRILLLPFLLSVVVKIPNCSFNFAVFSSCGLDTIRSSGLTTFCVRIPVIIACAMFPHPINPSFIVPSPPVIDLISSAVFQNTLEAVLQTPYIPLFLDVQIPKPWHGDTVLPVYILTSLARTHHLRVMDA